MPPIANTIARYLIIFALGWLQSHGVVTADDVGSVDVAAWANHLVFAVGSLLTIAWYWIDRKRADIAGSTPKTVDLTSGVKLIALLLVPILLLSGCGATGTGTADSSGSTGTTVSTNPLPTSWTQFGLEAAGAGSATAIILLADPNNPSGTATDILTVCDASLTVVVGETVPTSAQIETILASFKSDSNTTKFGLVAQQWAAKLQSQLTALLNSGATADQAQQYIAWYILGAQTAAQGYLLIAPLVD